MDIRKIYNNYHSKRKLQSKIIDENNFTYYHTLKLLKPYIKPHKKVLDIGSGTGTISLYLASKEMKVTGIDISSKAIKISKENAKKLFLSSKVNFLKLTFPQDNVKGKYDLIILSEVLEHIENEKLTIKRLYKMLNKNGILLITTPSQNAPLYRLGLLKKFDQEVGHLRRYTFESLLNLFTEYNIQVISLSKNEGFIRNFFFTNEIAGHLLRYINKLIPRLFNRLDELTIAIFGESDLQIILKKIS